MARFRRPETNSVPSVTNSLPIAPSISSPNPVLITWKPFEQNLQVFYKDIADRLDGGGFEATSAGESWVMPS
jgi:hypothetical protein